MNGGFVLPQGYKTREGEVVWELPMAVTTGEAERVFTKKPGAQGIYTWFGRIIAAAVAEMDGEEVSARFLKDGGRRVPEEVRRLSLVDVGSLLIQIQRECWQDVIEEQQVRCTGCGTQFVADIDLKRIEVRAEKSKYKETTEIDLGRRYEIKAGGMEAFAQWDGMRYDVGVFRVPTLDDAIRHEKLAQDEVNFWRKISLDCLLDLKDRETEMATGEDYIRRRGAVLMNKDWTTMTLKAVRFHLQTDFPSARFYYEDECPACGTMTPFFAGVQNFFSV